MSLESLTVYREKETMASKARNISAITGEAQAVSTERIIRAIPSVCKMDGVTNVNTGRVNSLVLIDQGKVLNVSKVWVSQTVAEIAALDD